MEATGSGFRACSQFEDYKKLLVDIVPHDIGLFVQFPFVCRPLQKGNGSVNAHGNTLPEQAVIGSSVDGATSSAALRCY